MKSYHASIIDDEGKERDIWGEALATSEETKIKIRKWCSKYGHRLIEDSYREVSMQPDPAFVDACLSDIAGFKR